jgi:hypothetical protein
MAKTNLTDHQTNPGPMLNLAYNPRALDRFKSKGGKSKQAASGGSGRPDWVDNPPEGMTVGKGISKSMGLAKKKAGVGGTQTHTEVDNGVYTVYVLVPAPDRPQEPIGEGTDIGLGDYGPPELEIDLEDLAPEEEEEDPVTALSDPQSEGLQGELQDRARLSDEIEEDFSNRRQQFLKTERVGQDSVLARDPNSLESQLLQQSDVTSTEPEEPASEYEPRQPLLQRFAPGLFDSLNRSAADDVTGNIAEAVDPSKFSAGGLTPEEYHQRSLEDAQSRVGRGIFGFNRDGQDEVDRAAERLDKFRFYEKGPTQDEAASGGVPRVSQNPPAPSASELMRASAENTSGFGLATPGDSESQFNLSQYYKSQPRVGEQGGATIQPARKAVTSGIEAPDMQRVEESGMPSQEMGTGGQGIGSQLREQGGDIMGQLARLGSGIGGFVKDNPDLVLQGLQTVGELGGAYKRSKREEEAARRMAEEARMGTAISALTRGRVNPSVAPQVPRTTAGEGMFDVLAGIGRGGQEFMAGERQRADKMRAEEIEEAEIARQTARDKELMDLDRYDAKTRRMAATGKIEKDLKEASDKEAEEAKETKLKQEESDYIAKQVSKMFALFDEGGPTETGTMSWDQSYGDAAELQQRFDSTRDSLIGYMNTLMKLGRMSDNDVKIILKALPNRDEGEGWNRGKVRGTLENLEAMSGGKWNKKTFEETGSGYEGGLLVRSDFGFGGFGQFSDEDLAGGLTEEDIEGMSQEMQAALSDELERRGF